MISSVRDWPPASALAGDESAASDASSEWESVTDCPDDGSQSDVSSDHDIGPGAGVTLEELCDSVAPYLPQLTTLGMHRENRGIPFEKILTQVSDSLR